MQLVTHASSTPGLISQSKLSALESQPQHLYRKNSHGSRSLSTLREELQTHPGSTFDISRIFLIEVDSPDYPFPEDCEYPFPGIVTTNVGSPTIEPLRYLPIDFSRRNAELLHFCKWPPHYLPCNTDFF